MLGVAVSCNEEPKEICHGSTARYVRLVRAADSLACAQYKIISSKLFVGLTPELVFPLLSVALQPVHSPNATNPAAWSVARRF